MCHYALTSRQRRRGVQLVLAAFKTTTCWMTQPQDISVAYRDYSILNIQRHNPIHTLANEGFITVRTFKACRFKLS